MKISQPWMPSIMLVAAAALLLAACSSGERGAGSPGAEARGDAGGAGFGHVHGLGVNPADGELYVASHLGVHRVSNGVTERIADRYEDTMAFTVIGPDHFLASGHPDLREDLPPHLGLIESTDAARTWRSVSLLGEADLHAIEVTGDRIYAYDAVTGTLMVSADRRNWDRRARLDLVDLAVSATDSDMLLATTVDGQLLKSTDGGVTFAALSSAPSLLWVDWAGSGVLVAVDADGAVHVSEDVGVTWRQPGSLGGAPTALETEGNRWYAATEHAVMVSHDEGATWNNVLASSR